MLSPLIAVGVVSFGLAAIALWASYLRSKTKRVNRQPSYRREDIQIDPTNVPEFKPAWRNKRNEGDCC